MSDTSLRFNFDRGRDTASPHMRRIAATATAMGAAQKAASLLAVGGYLLLGATIAGLIGHSVALVAAIAPVIGYLAAVPGVAFAAAAGLGALIVGFVGIGAALRTSNTGGAGAAQSLAAAERRVELAVRGAADAQDRLNDARRTATERIAEYARELAGARLDEEAATLAVARAEQRLRQARRSGDQLDQAEAELGLRQSLHTLDETRARLADVTAEEQRRREAGVEGSDEVQAALRQQADAMREVADAQRALTQGAGGGGIDKAAEAYAQLTSAGKQLVDVLRALKPEWVSLRAAVQQPLLAGVAGDVQALAAVWFPMLRTQLAGVAGGWNIAFRQSAQLAASPGFVADMNTALSNTVVFSEALGRAWAPFISGFRHFTVVGSTFLPAFGAWVERIANRFNDWAAAARESGRMEGWIRNATAAGRDLWALLVNLGGVIRAVFAAGSGGPNYLAGLAQGAAALRAYVESAEGQAKLAAFFTTLRDLGSAVWQVMKDLAPALLDAGTALGGLTDIVSVSGVVFGFLADHLDELAVALPYIIGALVAFKVAQLAYYAAAVVSVPVTIAQVVANFRLASALRANTVALGAQAAVTRVATGAQAGFNVAARASGPALQGAALGTRALGFAMKALPIIGWIALIVELVMWIVELWNTNEGFRNAIIGIWEHIWGFLKMIGAWFAGPFAGFFVDTWHWIQNTFNAGVAWVMGWVNRFLEPFLLIKKRIQEVGIWQVLVDGFKAAMNMLISLWNRLDFGISFPAIPLFGFGGLRIDDVIPDIPYLDTGGTILQTGLAVVHKGETVVPAGSEPMVIENHIHIGDEVVRVVRTTISERDRQVSRRVMAGSMR